MKDAKTIANFPNYKITKEGKLYSVKRGDPIEIAGCVWNGYRSVTLTNGDTKRNVTMHRLVAEAFVKRPKGMNIVNHLDGVKTNNQASNLEWTDHRGNMNHYSKQLAPVQKAKRQQAKKDFINNKLSVIDHAFLTFKGDPESFAKVYEALR